MLAIRGRDLGECARVLVGLELLRYHSCMASKGWKVVFQHVRFGQAGFGYQRGRSIEECTGSYLELLL